MMKHRLVASALVALVTGIAACGGETQSDSADGASNGGDPIKVGLISTLTGDVAIPETETGVKAAVEAINNNGGLNGRPLELVVCDNRYDQNVDARCGRKMVDEGVVALVGGFAVMDGHYQVTDAAALPEVGVYQASVAGYASKYTFPLSGYSVTSAAGPVAGLSEVKGAKRFAFIEPTGAAGSFTTTALRAAVASRPGASLVRDVKMTPGVPDPAPFLQKALAAKPDALMFIISPSDNDKLTALAGQVAPGVLVGRSGTTVSETTLKNLGKGLEGTVVSTQFLPRTYTKSPGVQRWVKEMEALDPDAVFTDMSANAWASVHVLAQVIESLKNREVTKETIVETLNSDRTWDPLLAPKVSFVKPHATPQELGLPDTYTRLFNLVVTTNQVKNESLVNISDAKFISPWNLSQ